MRTTDVQSGQFLYECFECGVMYHSNGLLWFCPNCQEFEEFYIMN